MESQGLGSGARVNNSGEINAVKNLLRKERNAPITIFDVGANRGEYTLALLPFFDQAQFYAFEPSCRTFEELVINLGSYSRVTTTNIALGQKTEKRDLYKESEYARIASLSELEATNPFFTETVDVHTIDEFSRKEGIDRIDLLKIDVEGHEMDVLLGAVAMIRKKQIYAIQFEFGEFNKSTKISLKVLLDFLTEAQYEINIIKPSNIVPLSRYDWIYEQYAATNFLAVLKHR